MCFRPVSAMGSMLIGIMEVSWILARRKPMLPLRASLPGWRKNALFGWTKVAPDVVVESANVEMDEASKPKLTVVLLNQGSARQKLTGMSLTVAPMEGDHALVDTAVTYKPSLPKDQTTHSLYAGYKRRCVLPWPESLPVRPVKVSVIFE